MPRRLQSETSLSIFMSYPEKGLLRRTNHEDSKTRGNAKKNRCSGEQTLHDLAVHVGETETASLVAIGQPFMVDAQQVQQRSLKIVDVHPVFHDVVAEFASFAVEGARLDPSARHPHAEAARV